jgi:hypothetical protein
MPLIARIAKSRPIGTISLGSPAASVSQAAPGSSVSIGIADEPVAGIYPQLVSGVAVATAGILLTLVFAGSIAGTSTASASLNGQAGLVPGSISGTSSASGSVRVDLDLVPGAIAGSATAASDDIDIFVGIVPGVVAGQATATGAILQTVPLAADAVAGVATLTGSLYTGSGIPLTPGGSNGVATVSGSISTVVPLTPSTIVGSGTAETSLTQTISLDTQTSAGAAVLTGSISTGIPLTLGGSDGVGSLSGALLVQVPLALSGSDGLSSLSGVLSTDAAGGGAMEFATGDTATFATGDDIEFAAEVSGSTSLVPQESDGESTASAAVMLTLDLDTAPSVAAATATCSGVSVGLLLSPATVVGDSTTTCSGIGITALLVPGGSNGAAEAAGSLLITKLLVPGGSDGVGALTGALTVGGAAADVELTGSQYTGAFGGPTGGSISSITIPADADICVVAFGIEETNNSTPAEDVIDELSWDGAGMDFATAVEIGGDNYPVSGVGVYYMVKTDGNWPGAGSGKTLTTTFANPIHDDQQYWIGFYKNVDTTSPIVATDTESSKDDDTPASTTTFTLAGMGANDMALVVGYFWDATAPDGTINGQTEVYNSSSGNNELSISQKLGEGSPQHDGVDYVILAAVGIKSA